MRHHMNAIPHQEVPGHRADGGIVRGFMYANLIGSLPTFQKKIVEEIELEIAAREDIVTSPWAAHGVEGERSQSAGNEVQRVPGIGGGREGLGRRVGTTLARPGEQQIDRVRDRFIDRVRDRFNMVVLFRRGVGDQIVEGTRFILLDLETSLIERCSSSRSTFRRTCHRAAPVRERPRSD